MSKIQIWKRITTLPARVPNGWSLYLICQRYKFESESQPAWSWTAVYLAVFNMSKIQIWKRITTAFWLLFHKVMLYLICQRYKFESESQLKELSADMKLAVFNMSKIQIWKRITTTTFQPNVVAVLYLICQRYKFESESQPTCVYCLNPCSCI